MTPVEEIEKQVEAARQKVIAYKKTFLSEDGQKVLADLSRECNEHRTTFIPGSPDRSAFLEGGRNVMLYIRRAIEANLDEPDKPCEATGQKESNDA